MQCHTKQYTTLISAAIQYNINRSTPTYPNIAYVYNRLFYSGNIASRHSVDWSIAAAWTKILVSSCNDNDSRDTVKLPEPVCVHCSCPENQWRTPVQQGDWSVHQYDQVVHDSVASAPHSLPYTHTHTCTPADNHITVSSTDDQPYISYTHTHCKILLYQQCCQTSWRTNAPRNWLICVVFKFGQCTLQPVMLMSCDTSELRRASVSAASRLCSNWTCACSSCISCVWSISCWRSNLTAWSVTATGWLATLLLVKADMCSMSAYYNTHITACITQTLSIAISSVYSSYWMPSLVKI